MYFQLHEPTPSPQTPSPPTPQTPTPTSTCLELPVLAFRLFDQLRAVRLPIATLEGSGHFLFCNSNEEVKANSLFF
jgi:hypothetical protein